MGKLNYLKDIYKDTCVKVYDPEATPKLIAVYENFNKAGGRLGITPTGVQKRCVTKTKVYSPNLDKMVAIRLTPIYPEDAERIEKTRKYIKL